MRRKRSPTFFEVWGFCYCGVFLFVLFLFIYFFKNDVLQKCYCWTGGWSEISGKAVSLMWSQLSQWRIPFSRLVLHSCGSFKSGLITLTLLFILWMKADMKKKYSRNVYDSEFPNWPVKEFSTQKVDKIYCTTKRQSKALKIILNTFQSS